MKKELCCALTGHRVLPETFDRSALSSALEELILEGYTTFLCGMARGFDLLALSCLVDLKGRYHVRIEACIPYRDQVKSMPAAEREQYERLLVFCDEKTVLSERYYPSCLLFRNRYMVDKCDLLLAYCTKSKGGAAYTVDYAHKRSVEVRMLFSGNI